MKSSRSKLIGSGDTWAAVTLQKTSVTAICHRIKYHNSNSLHFAVTLVTDKVCELAYAHKECENGVYAHFTCVSCIYRGNKNGSVTRHVSQHANRKGGVA